LQHDPDAVNFWLGNSLSTTALHKDPYENIYVQVLGEKHFILLPPIASPCVNEQNLPAARYETADSTGTNYSLAPRLDEPLREVPVAIWDPDVPNENVTPFSNLLTPVYVTLNPGDMLYLPALWYHKVSQSCNQEGICCAINYW
jgi:jumonji domain-containing protein 7